MPATVLEPVVSPPPADAAREALLELYAGNSLDADAAESLFSALVAGRLSDAEIASMLVALRLKGETVEELAGAAAALRAADAPFEKPDYLFADTCGTGGDLSGSINVSTAVAFVAAAAGLPVAKHGNRSITSRCGSADVLEALGARLEIDAAASRQMLDEIGFCFLFAPLYHPGLRHAGPVRRALKVRTIMNVLGPCLNPAEPPVQLLGVADPKLLRPVAETLKGLGTARALVIHGGGLDEVALHAETVGVQLENGRVEEVRFTPEEAGVERAPLAGLRGGDPAQNAGRLEAVLSGRGSAAEADMVAINTGALLMTAGLARGIGEGTAIAAETLATGAAFAKLQAYVEASRG